MKHGLWAYVAVPAGALLAGAIVLWATMPKVSEKPRDFSERVTELPTSRAVAPVVEAQSKVATRGPSTWEERFKEAVKRASDRPEWKPAKDTRLGAYCYVLKQNDPPLLGGSCAPAMFSVAEQLGVADVNEWVRRTDAWWASVLAGTDKYDRFPPEWGSAYLSLRQEAPLEMWEACWNVASDANLRETIRAKFEAEVARRFPRPPRPVYATLHVWDDGIRAALRQWKQAVLELQTADRPYPDSYYAPVRAPTTP